jgi:hypothetical protein
MLQMRAAAHILPLPVPIHAQRLIAGDRLDQLDLVGLVRGAIMGDGAGAVPYLGAHRIARVDDLAHPRLDAAKVFGGEGLGAVEIVIPAIRDHRADGHLHIGPDILHRAGHDMGKIVANEFKRRGLVLHRVDGDRGVAGDRPLQIPVLAVDMRRNSLFRQRRGDACRDLGGGDARVIAALRAIGKCQGNIGHIWLLVGLAPTERPIAGMCARDARSARRGQGAWARTAYDCIS